MIFDIFQALYLMLPAFFANMAPVLARNHLKALARPIDGRLKLRGKPLFGNHKTWRGLLTGTVVAILVAFIQYIIDGFLPGLSLISLERWYLVGFLLGFGALIGDMVESMFKRQLDIKEGHPFIPFDQIDFIIGSLLFLSIVYVPSAWIICIILAGSFILHATTNHIGFYLGIRKSKW